MARRKKRRSSRTGRHANGRLKKGYTIKSGRVVQARAKRRRRRR